MSDETKNQENSSFNEKPQETFTQRFDRERKEWEDKIGKMSAKMRDIGILSEVLTDALSQRQVALEYTHTLMSLLSGINAKLRKLRKERFLFYSQNYDLVLQKDQKNLFIDVDLEKNVKTQELFSNHLSYMRGTVDTIDKIIYGIKWRIQLEEYRRSQH